MDFITGLIPSSIGGVVWLIVQSAFVFLAIVLAEKFVTYNIQMQHAFILSVVAYFAAPLATYAVSYTGIILPSFIGLLLPLLVWIALGEVLIEGDLKSRAMVAIVAYGAYIIINVLPLKDVVLSAVTI